MSLIEKLTPKNFSITSSSHQPSNPSLLSHTETHQSPSSPISKAHPHHQDTSDFPPRKRNNVLLAHLRRHPREPKSRARCTARSCGPGQSSSCLCWSKRQPYSPRPTWLPRQPTASAVAIAERASRIWEAGFAAECGPSTCSCIGLGEKRGWRRKLRVCGEIMSERWMEEVEVELCTKVEMMMV